MPPYKVMKYWRHKKNVLLNIKLQKQNLNWIAYTHSVSLSLTILLQYNPSLWCWKKVFPNGNFVLSTVQTERAFQNLWHIRDASNFHSKIKNVFVLQFIFFGFFFCMRRENIMTRTLKWKFYSLLQMLSSPSHHNHLRYDHHKHFNLNTKKNSHTHTHSHLFF